MRVGRYTLDNDEARLLAKVERHIAIKHHKRSVLLRKLGDERLARDYDERSRYLRRHARDLMEEMN